jgi:hypothetical protein
MECSEFENALADALDRTRLSAQALEHLGTCTQCSRLTRELEVIAGRARQLADVEPAPELWSRIRSQLEREGVIQGVQPPPSARRASGKPKVVYSFPTGRPHQP